EKRRRRFALPAHSIVCAAECSAPFTTRAAPLRLFAVDGQVENEGGALARAVALRGERPAHFLRGERAAMEAETVALLARGEAVVENLEQIFLRNALCRRD